MVRVIISALFALIIASCSVPVQKPVRAVLPPDYELLDVRELPQDFRNYRSFPAVNSVGQACSDLLLAEFRQKYFAPWRGGKPLSDIPRSVETMKEHAGKSWYGENRRMVSGKVLDDLLANCDLGHFPSLSATAIALVPTSLRVLPTANPFLEKPDDFPFDALQNAGLKMHEPIRVLHLSADGVWAFAETADANGWVPVRDIGFIRESQAAEWIKSSYVVIVKDFAPIRDRQAQLAVRVKSGTLFPLVEEAEDSFVVRVAVPSARNGIEEIPVRVPKVSAKNFPLDMNAENITLIGNELIGKSYGWGELYQGRDCSALMRDFYLPFGVWLPRGSYNQITSGRYISLSGLSPIEKERFIRETAVPFLTIIHMRGHIMLYLGSWNDKARIFHSLWKVKVQDADGQVRKQVVGKAIISTLTPGSELSLANGSLLEKISSMLILSDRCGVARSPGK